jgi:hypothetical protein
MMKFLSEIKKVDLAIAKKEAKYQKLREMHPNSCKRFGPAAVEETINHAVCTAAIPEIREHYGMGRHAAIHEG